MPAWRVSAGGVRRGAQTLRWPAGVQLDLPLLRVYGAPGRPDLCLESPVARSGGAARWVYRLVLGSGPRGQLRLVHWDKTPYGSCRAVFERAAQRWAGYFSYVYLSEQVLAMARFHLSALDGPACSRPYQYRLNLPDAGNAFEFDAFAASQPPWSETCP